jgi:hypothetical protein
MASIVENAARLVAITAAMVMVVTGAKEGNHLLIVIVCPAINPYSRKISCIN